MFPNPNDTPAVPPQNAIHPAVAGLVRCHLLFPERAVVGRGVAMFRAAMPETAVHEKCEPRFGKYEVRLSKHGLIPSPAGYAVTAQESHQGKFRVLIALSLDG